MSHRQKLRFEVDPHNRLIAGISKFRHVIEGRFKIGKGGTLIYHIKAPSDDIARRLYLPHQLKFKGFWSLTKDHNLRLTLNKWRRQTFGDEITLKGEILKAEAHSLIFAVTQRTKENISSTYILRLEGNWQADKNNRLAFRVKRKSGRFDTLIFDGTWEINRKHKIIYHYEKWRTKKGKRSKHSLLFDGHWNLTERNVLTYRLDLKGKSAFDFRIGHGIARKDAIKFEIGIGLSRRLRPVKKYVILYGKWKIKNGVGLIFEVRHADGQISEIRFEAEVKLIGNSKIKFTLKNETGRGLGLAFTLSRKMLKGRGESFIRLLCSKREKSAYIGTGFVW